MLPWIIIGGVALFGWFALQDNRAGAAASRPAGPGLPPVPGYQPVTYPIPSQPSSYPIPPIPPPLGAPIPIASAGYPLIEQEMHDATWALAAAYDAARGCTGLTTNVVRRFQEAVNTLSTVHAGPVVLQADGVYDDFTDQIFRGFYGGLGYPDCVYTFEQAPVMSAQQFSSYGGNTMQQSPPLTTYSNTSFFRPL
jgi:hypothetical protein